MAIPQAHGVKRFGRLCAADSVCHLLKPRAALGCANRCRDHDSRRLQLSDRRNRGFHRGSGRQTVVDENDRALLEGRQRPAAAVQRFSPFELEPLAHRHLFHRGPRDSELGDEILAQHPDGAARNRAHGELRMARYAELADDEHIQRRIELARHLERDRHPASGQGQHDDVAALRVSAQAASQLPSRLGTVSKRHVRNE
jgi:hypothetical protein